MYFQHILQICCNYSNFTIIIYLLCTIFTVIPHNAAIIYTWPARDSAATKNAPSLAPLSAPATHSKNLIHLVISIPSIYNEENPPEKGNNEKRRN